MKKLLTTLTKRIWTLTMSKLLYTKCNYCKQVKPAEEVKGFKCVECMEKEKDKANGKS